MKSMPRSDADGIYYWGDPPALKLPPLLNEVRLTSRRASQQATITWFFSTVSPNTSWILLENIEILGTTTIISWFIPHVCRNLPPELHIGNVKWRDFRSDIPTISFEFICYIQDSRPRRIILERTSQGRIVYTVYRDSVGAPTGSRVVPMSGPSKTWVPMSSTRALSSSAEVSVMSSILVSSGLPE